MSTNGPVKQYKVHIDDIRDPEGHVRCHCNELVHFKTSHTTQNPNREFLACHKPLGAEGRCRFYYFKDEIDYSEPESQPVQPSSQASTVTAFGGTPTSSPSRQLGGPSTPSRLSTKRGLSPSSSQPTPASRSRNYLLYSPKGEDPSGQLSQTSTVGYNNKFGGSPSKKTRLSEDEDSYGSGTDDGGMPSFLTSSQQMNTVATRVWNAQPESSQYVSGSMANNGINASQQPSITTLQNANGPSARHNSEAAPESFSTIVTSTINALKPHAEKLDRQLKAARAGNEAQVEIIQRQSVEICGLRERLEMQAKEIEELKVTLSVLRRA